MMKRRFNGAGGRKAALLLSGIAMTTMLGGCVQVAAPEKPIEINLNINITQEVIVRLTDDVQALREREPGVF